MLFEVDDGFYPVPLNIPDNLSSQFQGFPSEIQSPGLYTQESTMAPVRGIKRSRSMEAKAADSAKEESVAVDGKLHKRPDDEEMAGNCRIGAVEWKDKEGRRDTALTFT